MNGPPKKKRAPAKSALQMTTDRIYELDEEAQERFWREARRLTSEFLRTEDPKHVRAFNRHVAGMLSWKGRRACLERVYAETGHSRGSLAYLFRQFENIEKESTEQLDHVLPRTQQLQRLAAAAARVFGWDAKEQPRNVYNTLVISPEQIERIRQAADEADGVRPAPRLERAPQPFPPPGPVTHDIKVTP